MHTKDQLVNLDCIYISTGSTKEEVFEEIFKEMLEKDLVTPDYFINLLNREAEFPTGLDLSIINKDFPNIAIPHTEGIYCKKSRIVPVKLQNEVVFKNMISPEEELTVKYLFMILNGNESDHCGMLAAIMDLFNQNNEEDVLAFFENDNKEEVFTFLNEKLNYINEGE